MIDGKFDIQLPEKTDKLNIHFIHQKIPFINEADIYHYGHANEMLDQGLSLLLDEYEERLNRIISRVPKNYNDKVIALFSAMSYRQLFNYVKLMSPKLQEAVRINKERAEYTAALVEDKVRQEVAEKIEKEKDVVKKKSVKKKQVRKVASKKKAKKKTKIKDKVVSSKKEGKNKK
ncbi:hypothetical protein HOB94_04270 [bacterium]|nr:hypothetical protein [bacterium]